jgi:hypothetical protein
MGKVGWIVTGAICAAIAYGNLSADQSPTASPGGCDPNYEPCVPEAYDVDCAGGTGDGPKYVSGPVAVTGYDVYGLDRDGDGTACDW